MGANFVPIAVLRTWLYILSLNYLLTYFTIKIEIVFNII